MATRTPEKNREYMRQYRAKNREKELERQRKYQAEYHERTKNVIKDSKIALVEFKKAALDLLDGFNTVSEQKRLASTKLREAINVIFQFNSILKNPNLTDAQKVEQTRN